MEAKNIRIGNYVWVDNKEYHFKLLNKTMVVCGMDKLCDSEKGRVQINHLNYKENITLPAVAQFDKYIKPIPLNEDWLKDLGFEYRLENGGNLPCYKMNIRGNLYTVARWGTDKHNLAEWQMWIESRDVCRVQYVHELQNVFFAITRTELQLKNES